VSTKAVKMIPGKVKRLHGTTRFDTNIAVLKEAGVSDEDVAICYAYNFADALSVSAAGVPVLLVDEALNETQKEELASLKSKKYFLIGGKQAVSDKVESEVSKYGNTERIAGNNRFETSRAIAERFFSGEQEKVYLTYGYNFPDGLCAGALCATKGNPLLLVSNENMAEAKSYIEKAKVKSCVVLGSEKLISDKAVMSILKK
ncbi:MAG: cell wall-binding repeat-containing protein, partial [Eubacterium sp.]|nr:cell wall-binding repeat-containing protein [Eubacterium sp.]